jgi:hypothetical protein
LRCRTPLVPLSCCSSSIPVIGSQYDCFLCVSCLRPVSHLVDRPVSGSVTSVPNGDVRCCPTLITLIRSRRLKPNRMCPSERQGTVAAALKGALYLQ